MFTFLIYATDYLFGVGVFMVAMLAAIEWLKFDNTTEDRVTKNLVIFCISTFLVSGFCGSCSWHWFSPVSSSLSALFPGATVSCPS